jgi:hypothetical protein
VFIRFSGQTKTKGKPPNPKCQNEAQLSLDAKLTCRRSRFAFYLLWQWSLPTRNRVNRLTNSELMTPTWEGLHVAIPKTKQAGVL